jgi:mono/diheme cytochrome c family protein
MIAGGLVLIAGVTALIGATAADAPYVGQAAAGKKLFIAKGCVACHKVDGSGGIKLTGNPTPNWRDPKRMADSTFDDAYLRDCIVNGKPKSGMVPWKKQLKPEQIEDLIALIRSFSRETAAKKK